jgi:hypothetical protein
MKRPLMDFGGNGDGWQIFKKSKLAGDVYAHEPEAAKILVCVCVYVCVYVCVCVCSWCVCV